MADESAGILQNEFCKAWEQIEWESPQAYEAFCAYRDLGAARNVRAVGQKLGKSRALMERWSSAHDWVGRAAEYDRYLENEARRAREAEHLRTITEFQGRQRRLSAAATEAAIRLYKIANARLEKAEEEEEVIPLHLLPRFYASAADMAKIGTAAEAEALGIDELLRHLDADEEDAG